MSQISSFWDNVVGTVEDAVDTVKEKASDAVDAVEETASSVANTVEDAASTAYDKVSETASDAANVVEETASDAADYIEDTASSAYDKVSETASEAADAVEDVADAAAEKVEEAADWVADEASDAADAVEDAADWLADKASDAADTVEDAVDSAVDTVEEAAQDVENAVLGISRGMNGTEKGEAQNMYQDSIDYDKVTIVSGGIGPAGAGARTIGNSVCFEDSYFDASTGMLTDKGLGILMHELTHVWQFQHGGAAYIPSALGAQLAAWVTTGDRDNAYDFGKAMREGIPWEEWNAEQQAEAMQKYHEAKHRIDTRHAETGDQDVVDTLQPYLDKVRRGEGAPEMPDVTM